MCLADSRLFMPGLNLTYTDRASMAASTEVRVPFVDPVVFGAAFSLPGTARIPGGVKKAGVKEPRERGSLTRSSTARRRPSARRCAPG